MRRQKLVNKKGKKLYEGKCRICGENNYELLDLHRLHEGHKGGTYSDRNTVVLCSNCHRKAHAEIIVLDRLYLRSDGKWVLRYIDENGLEHYN